MARRAIAGLFTPLQAVRYRLCLGPRVSLAAGRLAVQTGMPVRGADYGGRGDWWKKGGQGGGEGRRGVWEKRKQGKGQKTWQKKPGKKNAAKIVAKRGRHEYILAAAAHIYDRTLYAAIPLLRGGGGGGRYSSSGWWGRLWPAAVIMHPVVRFRYPPFPLPASSSPQILVS